MTLQEDVEGRIRWFRDRVPPIVAFAHEIEALCENAEELLARLREREGQGCENCRYRRDEDTYSWCGNLSEYQFGKIHIEVFGNGCRAWQKREEA